MHISNAERAELSKLLHSLTEKVGKEDGSGELHREVERNIQAAHDAIKSILKYGRNDVFVRYLLDQLDGFARVCSDASGKCLLRVTDHEFTSAQLLVDAFADSERVYRFTWKIMPGQRLFDDPVWKRHFEMTVALAAADCMDVRSLMIMDDRHLCDAANVHKVLGFFASQPNLSCKTVLSADWDACAMDHAVPSECVEFGIFGENLLYEAKGYHPVPVGSWSKNEIDITRHIRLFDTVWNAGVACSNPVSAQHKVRLSEVMAADGAVDRRHHHSHNAVHDNIARIEEGLNSAAA